MIRLRPLREGLPPLPSRMQALPVDGRGYPIPWFVATLPDGTRDFRVSDGDKMILAIQGKRCWVCGERLGRFLTFCLGPMCAVNRTIGEPPSHAECALFSATACPFLTLPKAKRREANLPAGQFSATGIRRNPGVVLLWTCLEYKPFRAGDEILFRVGDPVRLEWFCEGRQATREEVMESIESGLPILREMAEKEGPEALVALQEAVARAMPLVPA